QTEVKPIAQDLGKRDELGSKANNSQNQRWIALRLQVSHTAWRRHAVVGHRSESWRRRPREVRFGPNTRCGNELCGPKSCWGSLLGKFVSRPLGRGWTIGRKRMAPAHPGCRSFTSPYDRFSAKPSARLQLVAGPSTLLRSIGHGQSDLANSYPR